MKRHKRLFSVLIAVLCVVALATSVSAASVVSKSAGEFGTLTGTLHDSIYRSYSGTTAYTYEFSFTTTVTKSPGQSSRLYGNVECRNNATGALIIEEDADHYTPGGTYAGYYVEMDRINNIRGENAITVAVFGCHEARYTNSYAVYTNRTYNLARDHGVV